MGNGVSTSLDGGHRSPRLMRPSTARRLRWTAGLHAESPVHQRATADASTRRGCRRAGRRLRTRTRAGDGDANGDGRRVADRRAANARTPAIPPSLSPVDVRGNAVTKNAAARRTDGMGKSFFFFFTVYILVLFSKVSFFFNRSNLI